MKPVEITLKSADYTDVSTVEAQPDTLNIIRDRIKSRSANYRIETGRDLLKAKALLPHGEFGPWLKANLSHLSESTAQNYMNAARATDKDPEIEKLAPTAAIAFSAPNTPETVKSEIVAEIKAGNVPTTKVIKAKIAAAKADTTARQASLDSIAREVHQELTAKLATTAAGIREIMADAVADAVSGEDLVARLKAAGLDTARAAFESAFPGYTVLNAGDLDGELGERKAA